MKAIALTLLLASLVALSACSDNRPSPEQVANDYLLAQRSGDWNSFCALLSTDSAKLVQQALKKQTGVGESCAQALSVISERSQEQFSALSRGVKITGAEVNGSGQAVAQFSRQGQPGGELNLIEEDGQWRVALGAGALEG